MSDLIDRQAAIDAVNDVIADYIPNIYGRIYGRYETLPLELASAVNRLPSAQLTAEPVRHGKWIEKSTGGVHFNCCSECGEVEWDTLTNYCPYCGARMDAE